MNHQDKEFLVEKIKTQYTEKEHTALDTLKELDQKVKRPALTFAYVFGSVSAIVMGSGMSLIMTDIGEWIGMNETMLPGIVIGVMGLVLAVINYPLYKKILAFRKEKYTAQIIELSEQILKN